MINLKICVYAICKNEEKFVDRFCESVKDADGVYVLDTGSSDDTIARLENHGVNVTQKIIDPWRFDVARNLSLELVPEDYDVCVCLDLDEVLEKGWKDIILNNWQNDTTRLRYNYIWRYDEYGNPSVNFLADKIHARKNYKWVNPVHEILSYNGEEKFITCENLTISHYPDNNKSRSSYLPLLELAVKEDPTNDRNTHYLGREYMYYQKWNEAIDMLIRHLNLPNATWKDERCASMRFIARCYKNLNRFEETKMWLNKAILEAPYLRDPYVETALLYYQLRDWNNVIKYCNDALKIESHAKSYINETFSWDYTIYDLLSISYYNIGNYNKSKEYVDKAIIMAPNDERLKNNKIIIEKKLVNDVKPN